MVITNDTRLQFVVETMTSVRGNAIESFCCA